MGNTIAGTLTLGANGHLTFTYDDAYRQHASATPISLSMPLAVRAHADTAGRRTVNNFLRGLLPDDDEVRKRWADFFQVRTAPFHLLGTPVGRDCAGAVSFCPQEDVAGFLSRGGSVTPLAESDVAALIGDLRRDRTLVLGAHFEGEFSLAGAQAKIALVYDEESRAWGMPHGTAATNRILKPASAGWTDQDVNEHLCLAAAGIAGIRTARSEILVFGDHEVIASDRYDRARGSDGFYRRIHQEDLCQAFGVGPDKKYEREGGPGIKAIASLFRRVMPRPAAEAAVRAFADALAWNWIIAGTDNHAKNYSLLLSRNDVRLAPVYDVSSMLPYLGTRSPVTGEVIQERRTRSAMKIGGHYEHVPVHNVWPHAARELGLDPDRLVSRVRDLARVASDAFSDAGRTRLTGALRRRLVGDLTDRVASRADRCLNVLG